MTLQHLIAAVMAVASPHSSERIAEDVAQLHVEAAQAAADEFEAYDIPVELLLGMAYVESHYNPVSLSRIECDTEGVCKRVAGKWRSSKKPPRAKPTYYCGVMQVGGYIPWKRCQELRDDLTLNYHEGAAHLAKWMDDANCRHRKGKKRLTCALAGYGGGYAAIKKGSKYPGKCLASTARIVKYVKYYEKKEAEPNT